MYNKPNTVFWYTVNAIDAQAAVGELVGAMNSALATIAKFASRSGNAFHSLKTNGRKVRMYLRVNANTARANIKRADSRFQDLPPQHDYDSPVPAEQGTDEPFAAPPGISDVAELIDQTKRFGQLNSDELGPVKFTSYPPPGRSDFDPPAEANKPVVVMADPEDLAKLNPDTPPKNKGGRPRKNP